MSICRRSSPGPLCGCELDPGHRRRAARCTQGRRRGDLRVRRHRRGGQLHHPQPVRGPRDPGVPRVLRRRRRFGAVGNLGASPGRRPLHGGLRIPAPQPAGSGGTPLRRASVSRLVVGLVRRRASGFLHRSGRRAARCERPVRRAPLPRPRSARPSADIRTTASGVAVSGTSPGTTSSPPPPTPADSSRSAAISANTATTGSRGSTPTRG